MKKVLFVATVVKTHLMQFHIPYLKMLKEMGWHTAVAARNDYENPDDCRIPYCDEYFDLPFARNPLHPSNLRAYLALKSIIHKGGYDVIHCHTPTGAALARLAAGSARKHGTRVLYTAHGFHFYHGAPLSYWALYYPIERLLARRTDVLVTINQEDYARAKKFPAGKVVYLPGVGIDLSAFTPSRNERARMRASLGLGEGETLLLCVGELIPRKNHILVLDALQLLQQRGRLGTLRCVICGDGPLAAELLAAANARGLSGRVQLLGYRKDVNLVCQAADLFALPSLQEGLPVALMEAMASGLPVICSKIRGNADLIRNGENGLMVPGTAEAFAEAIDTLQNSPALCAELAKSAVEDAKQYDIQNLLKLMRPYYG